MPRKLLRLLQVALGCLLITFVVNASLHAQRVGPGRHAGVTSPPRSFAPPVRNAIQPGHPFLTQNHHQNQHQRPQPVGDDRRGVGYRRHYPNFYAGYPAYPGLLSFGYGLPFGYGNDQQESAPQVPPDFSNEPPVDPSPEVAASEPPPFRPAYQPQTTAAPARAQPATTLVFNDGRPSMEVHNYALIGSTLYALDGETRQEIALSQLNLAATIEANRKTGVDFAVPTSH